MNTWIWFLNAAGNFVIPSLYLMSIGGMIWMMTQPLIAARFHMFSPVALGD